jgi:YkoY family integral membrane protein
MDVHVTDFLTIGLLVILEGLLSADNALVLAILVLGLPRSQQKKALRYGIIGAFGFRILAVLLAVQLLAVPWVKLVGGLYLLYLSWSHFFGRGEGEDRRAVRPAKPWLGLSAFWGTVVKVELTDVIFAVDSILVAVAMSPKIWVIITGGLLGIVAMRLVIGHLLRLVRRYPALVDAAFVIIAWVAIKLLVEYLNTVGYIEFHINKWFSFALIVVIFAMGYVYARKQGPVEDLEVDQETAGLLGMDKKEQ